MEYELSIVFLATNGKKTSFSISNVKDTITQSKVSTMMDTIIAKNIFLAKNGALVGKHGASLT
ncbi:MAG: DUF2922 domain-containing protein [Clostridium sp.]